MKQIEIKEVYQLYIFLEEIEPLIWRRLKVE